MEDIDTIGEECRKLTQLIIEDVLKKRNKLVEDYILLNATPKIKGELTKGKVRWRGIKVIINSFDDWQVWQRNEPISPIIKINFP